MHDHPLWLAAARGGDLLALGLEGGDQERGGGTLASDLCGQPFRGSPYRRSAPERAAELYFLSKMRPGDRDAYISSGKHATPPPTLVFLEREATF